MIARVATTATVKNLPDYFLNSQNMADKPFTITDIPIDSGNKDF